MSLKGPNPVHFVFRRNFATVASQWQHAEMDKAQLKAQSATSATSIIAEIALRSKVFKVYCAAIALRYQLFFIKSSIL